MANRSFMSLGLVVGSILVVGCSADDSKKPDASSPWAGHTYALMTTTHDWREPLGLGGAIETVMPVFLFEVTEARGKDVSVRVGVAPKVRDEHKMPTGEITQDLCSPTYDVPVSGASYPQAELGPRTLFVHLTNKLDMPEPADDVQVTAEVTGFDLTDIFPPNGSTWADPDDKLGKLHATMDLRALAPLFTLLYKDGQPPTVDAIIEQLSGSQPVVACADGVVTCLGAEGELIGAEDRSDITVAQVDLATRPASCSN